MTPPTTHTITGSDYGGGADIQGDLKTFAGSACTARVATTALTAPNGQGPGLVDHLHFSNNGSKVPSIPILAN